MKFINIFAFIFIIYFLIEVTKSDNDCCKSPNVGSVLFRDIDLHRKDCWSQEEIALLYTRRVMQEILPRQIPRNIPLLIDYIKMCLDTAKQVAPSKRELDFLLIALADAFGGYLQSYGLPILNEAYYEGYVGYNAAKSLHTMQCEFKKVLKTDGSSWTRTMKISKPVYRVLPLKIGPDLMGDPCLNLITDVNTKRHPKSITTRDTTENKSLVLIPMPLIDDDKEPNSIALPLKDHSLYSLKNKHSYDILVKYYDTSSKCIMLSEKMKKSNMIDMCTFDQMFYSWLKKNVIPHLYDGTWYIGFNSVLCIVETIEEKGMIPVEHKESNDTEPMFPDEKPESTFAGIRQKTILIGLFVLILFLLLICCIYWVFIKNTLFCLGKFDIKCSKTSISSETLRTTTSCTSAPGSQTSRTSFSTTGAPKGTESSASRSRISSPAEGNVRDREGFTKVPQNQRKPNSNVVSEKTSVSTAANRPSPTQQPEQPRKGGKGGKGGKGSKK